MRLSAEPESVPASRFPIPDSRFPMLNESLLTTAIKAGVVAAIGAFVTIFVERAWKRHKTRQQAQSRDNA